ncbi:flavodoxin domain-containing protein [Flavitalea sp. BT771]|uniref:flavodoxin domain-containing protein n=1 Tax=Flavitalea sp. BT771 TaxID=3063329 RepID=UPI0026E38E2E|nr:flavodoxin domain-containing protein [Flavitalea sp. BT771]MDO6432707.1 flavodoxin domain-containing protein [Flavitalea sp. BT771]MDV6222017.1 flavodoxin domain-containing protein [Flavitalea sp. BT771]
MNGLVLYRSRYGATRQYAEWIGTDLRLPVIDPDMLNDQLLAGCDFLVIGTSVYLGDLLLKAWLKGNKHRLEQKKLFFFIVCAPSPDASGHGQIIMDNIPGDLLRPSTDIVFLPGRWIFRQLSPTDGRVLKEKALAETDPAKKAALSQDSDAVKKEHIAGLLDAVRSFNQSIEM